MWNDYELPTVIKLGDRQYEIKYKFNDVLDIFKVMADPDLLDQEKLLISLEMFYPELESIPEEYIQEASEMMCLFLDGNRKFNNNKKSDILFSWEQDFPLIVAPINKILGYDVRTSDKDVHWWTFLSAFMEIGECTFNTFVGIRHKKAKHKKLDSYEEEIYKENRDRIDLVKKYDSTTQSIIDEIMGRKG